MTGKQVMELLQHTNKEQGITTVLITHDPEIAKYATQTIQMEYRKIVN